MKGTVLLIVPWIYDFAAYDLWSEPLGLLYIGAILREYGYEVQLVDCLDRHHPHTLQLEGRTRPRSNAYGCGKFHKTILEKPPVLAHIPRRYGRYGIPLRAFDEDLIHAGRPDVILVTSGMTYWYPGPWEAVRRARAIYPKVPIVLGGIYSTLCTAHAQGSGADYVIAGPGELQAVGLVDRLTGNSPEPHRVPHRLEDFPYPAHDLRRAVGHVGIITSRGCPFHCTYCASDLLYPSGFERRSPIAVADEIEHHCNTYGVADFAFYDDALLVDAEAHIEPCLDEIIRRELPCRLHTPNGLHARYVTERLAAKMRQAGFATIRLGLETTDPDRQRKTGGKVSASDLRRALEILSAAGFEPSSIGVYVLVGLPGQPPHEVEETIDYTHECGAQVRLALYSPIPGTSEWGRAAAEGSVAPVEDPLLHNNSIYAYHNDSGGYVLLQALKERARAANEDLLAGTQLTPPISSAAIVAARVPSRSTVGKAPPPREIA